MTRALLVPRAEVRECGERVQRLLQAPYNISSTMDTSEKARATFRCTATRVADYVEYERAVLFASRAVNTPAGCRATSLHVFCPGPERCAMKVIDVLLALHDRFRDAWICMQGARLVSFAGRQ